jgi:hypothetical protein
MSVTKTWKIEQMERSSSDGLVTTVHWRVNGSETVGDNTYYSTAYGSVGLTRGDEFIAYDSLTEADVIGWVKTSLGADTVDAHEKSLSDQIVAQKNPVTLTGKPW